MRFICNQNVFVLIKHALFKGDGFFIFQLAVIENASANSKSSLRVDAPSGFIPYLTFRHPRLPGRSVDVGKLFFEKVDDGFPRPCWKPLAAWSNSFDEGKRSVQINLVLCYVSLNNRVAAKRVLWNSDAADEIIKARIGTQRIKSSLDF